MNKKFYLSLIGLYFAFSFAASAQKRGFVVTNNGDTIACKIKFSIFGSASYKPEKEEKFKKVTVKDIRYYRAMKDSTTTRAAKAVFMPKGKKRVFVDIVQEGDITLYEVVNSGYNRPSSSIWYIDKGTDTLKLLKTNALAGGRTKRKEMFAELLKDKPDVYNKYMADDSFGFETISNIVYLYNSTMPYKSDAWRKDQALFLKWFY